MITASILLLEKGKTVGEKTDEYYWDGKTLTLNNAEITEYDFVQIGTETTPVDNAQLVITDGTKNTIKGNRTYVDDHCLLVYGNLAVLGDGSDQDNPGSLYMKLDDNISGAISAVNVSGDFTIGSTEDDKACDVEVYVGNCLKQLNALKVQGSFTALDGSLTLQSDVSTDAGNATLFVGESFSLGEDGSEKNPVLNVTAGRGY